MYIYEIIVMKYDIRYYILFSGLNLIEHLVHLAFLKLI